MTMRLSWRRYAAVGLCFGLLVWLMTLPAPFTLSTRLIGNDVDNWVFYWNNWWLGQALSTGHPVLFTPFIFFPQGASLVAHSNSFLTSLLALALRPMVGPVAAANLVLLCGLWIGAVGMFRLTYDLTRSPAGALVAGFVFTFAPYHMTKALAHPSLGFIHWWPWYALMLRRALHPPPPDAGGRGNRYGPLLYALGAGLFAALTFWTGLQLAVMQILWTLAYAGWLLVRAPRSLPRWMELGTRLAIVALVTGVLSAPLIVPIAGTWNSGWTEGFDEGTSDQTDLLAYLTPPTYHPLWGDQVQPIYERFDANRATMPYLGYTAVFLAWSAVGFPWRGEWRRRVRHGSSLEPADERVFWWLTLILWVLLAAGSALRVNGVLYDAVRLPYSLIADVFPISTMRSPDRLNVLTVFSLAALAGYGAALLARRRRALFAVGILLLIEYLSFPLPRWELLPDSPFYAQMAADGADYAVLDYPMGYNRAKQWLYYQTLHGKLMVDGHISRYTPELYTLILGNSLIRALHEENVIEKPALLPGDTIAGQVIPPEDVGAALRELADLGVRYILVHKPYVDGEADAHFRRVVPLAPAYEDETLAVYDLTAPLAVTYDGFPVVLSADLALTRFDVRVDTESGWRFQLVVQARRDLESLPACTLALAEAGTSPAYAIAVDWQARSLKAGDLAVRELSAQGGVPPGDYQWALRCAQTQPYHPPEHWLVTPDGARYTRALPGATFSDVLTLSGYRWRTEGAHLKLDLAWDVLRAPGANYKLFVHLLDAEGVLVAQYDAIPCASACPTSEWQPGQRIHDSATLPLWNLPPGGYHLALGWYHEETGDRLPATAAQDGYVMLPGAFEVRHP